jgi:tetratricopeptide (TPR) repeat protein
MMFSVGLFRTAPLLLVGLMMSGCLPSAPRDEEKEPYFLAGKNCLNTMDFKGAVESFEKALEVNPKSAPAHFELGWLYDQKESDPAAAIYHYERFLKLSPNSAKEERVRTRILACKQQLAQSVSLGPLTEKQQRDFEMMAEETKHLREEVEKWRAAANRLPNPTNQSSAGSPAKRSSQASVPGQSVSTTGFVPKSTAPGRAPVTSASSSRTHVVKAGETPGVIAHKYGIKVEALLAANPGLDPRRLRVGQTLAIPGS